MKIAVYAVITGDYDQPKPVSPEFKKEADFFLFTERGFQGSNYQIILFSMPDLSLKKSSRIIKLLPHKFLKDYDYTLYLDGSVELLESPANIVKKYASRADIIVHKHPWRKCIYEECKAVVDYGFVPKAEVQKQKMFLMSQHYPRNNGLTENGVILRKNTPMINRLNEYWWKVCNTYTYRDQLSFCFCAWKLGVKYGLFDGQTRADRQPKPTEFLLYPHK